jgi:hypothetical protein
MAGGHCPDEHASRPDPDDALLFQSPVIQVPRRSKHDIELVSKDAELKAMKNILAE